AKKGGDLFAELLRPRGRTKAHLRLRSLPAQNGHEAPTQLGTLVSLNADPQATWPVIIGNLGEAPLDEVVAYVRASLRGKERRVGGLRGPRVGDARNICQDISRRWRSVWRARSIISGRCRQRSWRRGAGVARHNRPPPQAGHAPVARIPRCGHAPAPAERWITPRDAWRGRLCVHAAPLRPDGFRCHG